METNLQKVITGYLMNVFDTANKYHMKVQPHSHLRVTKGDRWIFASTDEYLKAYDAKKGSRSYYRKQQLVRSDAHKREIEFVAKKNGFKWGDESCYMIVFMRHMPKTWRKGIRKPGKRDLMAWKPMKSKPDIDNFYKRVSDTLMKEDKLIWCVGIMKLWVPDEIEEGTYFIDVPFIFDVLAEYVRKTLSV